MLDCCARDSAALLARQVVEEFAALLKSYGISRVTGDAYAGEWPRERFASHGITYDVSTPEQEPNLRRVLAGAERPAGSLARSCRD